MSLKLPKGRTFIYSVWRGCERLGIRPPAVKASWDDCNVVTQSKILAYEQIRSVEEIELALAGIQ